MFQLLDSQCVVYAESPPSLNDLWRKRLSFSCQCNSESGLIMCRSMIRKPSRNLSISKYPSMRIVWSRSLWIRTADQQAGHSSSNSHFPTKELFLHSTLKVSTSTPGRSARQKRRSCLFHRRHFSSPCLILAAGCVTSALAALGARCPVRACTRSRARGQLRSRIRRSRRRRRAGRGLRRRRWKPAERAAQPVKQSSKSQSLKVVSKLETRCVSAAQPVKQTEPLWVSNSGPANLSLTDQDGNFWTSSCNWST